MNTNRGYFKMTNSIFCYDLTPLQLAVYSYLVSCAGSTGKAWPSMKTIAANCGCCVTTASNAVKVLDARGFIRVVRTYAQKSNGQKQQTNNTYYILDLPALKSVPKTGVEYLEDPLN